MHRGQHIAQVSLQEGAVERVRDRGGRSEPYGISEPAPIVLVRSERRPLSLKSTSHHSWTPHPSRRPARNSCADWGSVR